MSDDITARVKLRENKILSDDYYVLRRADFDFLRSDGTWQNQTREAMTSAKPPPCCPSTESTARC